MNDLSFLENGLDKTTGFCVGLTAVAFGLPAGASELAVGAAGLIGFVLGKNKKFGPECERVREKIQKQVLNTYKHKITGSDGNWQADADLIAADKSLQECLGDCMIERSQLVGVAVSPKGFSEKAVDIVMEQLAANYPDQFGEKRTDDLPYNFARDVVSAGIEEAKDNAEYYRTIEHSLAWEMARALGQVREDVTDIKADTSVIISNQKLAEDYDREIKAVQQSNNASEMELLSLMRFILDRHIPRENIQPELESAYQRLTQLRDNFGDLTSLANEAPEIAPLLKEADEALQAGDGFSLEKAEKVLKKADERYEEIISTRDEQVKNDKLNRAKILIKRAEIAKVKFNYKAAQGFYEAELTLMKDVNGEDHEDTANSYSALASNFNDQGKYKQAEPLYRKALAIKECIFGEEHPDTAIGYNNLAGNLNAQGRYDEAEHLYRKALETFEGKVDEESEEQAACYNNIAYNLDAQGLFEDAEPFYHKAIKICEQIWGEEHPKTAISYNNYAANYQARGKYKDAEVLFVRAMEIRKLALGEDHPTTASSYANVASILSSQGLYDDAEFLLRRALEIKKREFTLDHPKVARTYNSLAANLSYQGKYDDAEPLFKKALEIRERAFGDNHPDTANSYHNLAFNLNARSKYVQAEPLFRKALKICMVVLGETHPHTILVYNNLASNLDAQGKHEEAEEIRKKLNK